MTQKESSLLQDMKAQEQLCVEKYSSHAECANDPQLQNLFSQIKDTEQQHLNTIEEMIKGVVPQTTPSSQGKQSSMTFTATYDSLSQSEEMKHDKYLCSDALAIEKHASSVYNTSIFEFRDTKMRDVLNHLQTEEQGHGDMIYHYMSANGMYNA